MSKLPKPRNLGVMFRTFCHLILEFVSNFELRYSDFYLNETLRLVTIYTEHQVSSPPEGR
jgi:hypothetical protein